MGVLPSPLLWNALLPCLDPRHRLELRQRMRDRALAPLSKNTVPKGRWDSKCPWPCEGSQLCPTHALGTSP